MQWLNEPAHWTHEGNRIAITADGKTDFWRITHDGGVRDTGHFYYQPVNGDFVAAAKFSAAYSALYDQAGLMVRLDETTWLKCGIELFNGVQHASVVVTRDFSDWSVIPLPGAPPALWLRLTRHAATVEVAYTVDGADYVMLRQAYLTPAEALQVGVMCCAPTGDGFTATFEGFRVESA
jgi:regulation of enolase protein 1 (concanavalin A-like superfamily)